MAELNWVEYNEPVHGIPARSIVAASRVDGTTRYFRIHKDRSRWKMDVALPHAVKHYLFKTKRAAVEAAEHWDPACDNLNWAQARQALSADYVGIGNGLWQLSQGSWQRHAAEAAGFVQEAEIERAQRFVEQERKKAIGALWRLAAAQTDLHRAQGHDLSTTFHVMEALESLRQAIQHKQESDIAAAAEELIVYHLGVKEDTHA